MRLADLPGFRRYFMLLSFAASRPEEFRAWCKNMEKQ